MIRPQKPIVPDNDYEASEKSIPTVTYTPNITTKPLNVVKNPNIVYKLVILFSFDFNY